MRGVNHRMAVIVMGAAVIEVGALVARRTAERRLSGRVVGSGVPITQTPNVLAISHDLWRGPAPDADGLKELAAAGVNLVVDLRAEVDPAEILRRSAAVGVEVLLLPITNTRAPGPADLEAFAHRHEANDGITYIHCEAGEGRTGALVGAHQRRSGRPFSAIAGDALAIGSLTFGQLAFMALGGRLPLAVAAIEWLIDRPTEAVIDMARARSHEVDVGVRQSR